MHPQFAAAIDPIFIATDKLVSAITSGASVVVSDERNRMQSLIDNAELNLKNSDDWQLAKYAICAWIDSQMITAPWKEKAWWADHSLERMFYREGIAHHEFYLRAARAQQRPSKDALEVYFLAVILGFRGFYNEHNAEDIAHKLNLPPTLDQWCAQISRMLQLQQDRPLINETTRKPPLGAARPLTGRSALINTSMISVVLVAAAIGFFLIFRDQVQFPRLPFQSTDSQSAPAPSQGQPPLSPTRAT